MRERPSELFYKTDHQISMFSLFCWAGMGLKGPVMDLFEKFKQKVCFCY